MTFWRSSECARQFFFNEKKTRNSWRNILGLITDFYSLWHFHAVERENFVLDCFFRILNVIEKFRYHTKFNYIWCFCLMLNRKNDCCGTDEKTEYHFSKSWINYSNQVVVRVSFPARAERIQKKQATPAKANAESFFNALVLIHLSLYFACQSDDEFPKLGKQRRTFAPII